ncbi:glycoside hydrolase family 16 protein [Myriangium duriaei CBS 260.36]|uniref:Crh-like protein n=1 Tax=Myriangium duriaei CBS 260.36 TaxID=1168546 RepID=A0A9P4MK18_9PEZI|nr:glycoside hydrolase family 16 protein [Myriangium duriaei CBS 260.36]
MVALRNIFSSTSTLQTVLLLASPVFSQTSSSCNPTKGQTCQPDPALGRAASYNFASGASQDFTASGSPVYGSNGVSLTVSKSGDAPQLNSNWYIMFGKYEITMQAAPGAGIVSSVVLQSDDLDEIDWEFLGANPQQGQTNYFGKADTSSNDRAAFLAVSNTQEFHTYGIEWTEKQIIWSVDGTTVRVLSAAQAGSQYPQTPMQLKFGVWAGGDPSNPPGTIQWAEGPTVYSSGPFTMVVKSLSVTDYSTGTSYKYGDSTGSWGSISAIGGTVNGNAGGATETTVASPAITSTSSGGVPWTGTHRSSTSLTTTYTTYPGLPSGWSVTSSGKVVPSSATPVISVPITSVLAIALSLAAGLVLGGSYP